GIRSGFRIEAGAHRAASGEENGGSARIYLYAPPGGRIFSHTKVFCDGRPVAELHKEHFIVLKASPGMHTITYADQESTVSIDGGRDNYVRIDVEGFVTHFIARAIDPAEAMKEMQ